AYRARTVRLTSERVRASLPTTENELRADKDRIRADNALRVHRLETQLEHFKFDAARQQVEVGRRDGQINALTSSLDTSRAEMEAALNARNVLEQTIADRLPKVEQRLIEAKKLLFQRDREIANLGQDAERTQRALVEAVQINTQQRSEIERLNMVLDTRAAQNRDGLADPTFDTELALRAEIEALRSRTRDQASVLDRLQGGEGGKDEQAASDDATVPEVVRLQRDLVRAETALKAMKDVASAGQVDQSRYDTEVRQRDQKIEDQAQEIARLGAALATYEAGPDVGSDRGLSIKDSKIAMKSKLSSLQVQTEAQAESIRKLRAEVAASNEKLARQAQHFMEEMRRLGAGTLPASAQARRPPSAAVRRTLTQRITAAKPELAHGAHAVNRPVLVKSEPVALPAPKPEPAKVEDVPAVASVQVANGHDEAKVVAEPAAIVAARPRLMDRITDYGKG
ncbi:MAG: hypothetical protein ABL904_22350, partial [Hyphomicrobiaceae bacterium]